MAYTEYRSTDSGAPVLSGTAGSLIALLDACLVDGYGAKAAAGWTKNYSGTNKAVYRPSHGSRFYLRVLDDGSDGAQGARLARVRGYESMSDVDTGTGEFPTDAQVSGGLYLGKSSTADSTARPWVVLADGKRAIVMIAHHASHSQSYTQSFFGDLGGVSAADPYAAMLVAAKDTTNAVTTLVGSTVQGASVVHGMVGVTASGYSPRARVGTGTSSGAHINRGGTVSGNSTFTTGPDTSGNVWTEAILVRDTSTYDSNAPRGYVPGILFLMNNMDSTSYPSFYALGSRYVLRCASNAVNAFIVDPEAGGNSV
jgi:hypothetical protein